VTARPAQADDEDTEPRWKTFGRGERALELEPAQAPAASFGWAMTSPLLALAEGTRTIKLRLGFAAEGPKFDLQPNPFQVELSTAKGWLAPQSAALEWAKAPFDLDHPRPQGAAPQKLLTLVITQNAGRVSFSLPKPLGSHAISRIRTPVSRPAFCSGGCRQGCKWAAKRVRDLQPVR
jgi:hypothetical protein